MDADAYLALLAAIKQARADGERAVRAKLAAEYIGKALLIRAEARAQALREAAQIAREWRSIVEDQKASGLTVIRMLTDEFDRFAALPSATTPPADENQVAMPLVDGAGEDRKGPVRNQREIGKRDCGAPLDARTLSVSGGVGGDSEAWYYTNPKTLDVVVEVHSPSGEFVGTITLRVKR